MPKIFSADKTLQIWLLRAGLAGQGRAGQPDTQPSTNFCLKLHFSTQETAVRHFLTHFFRRKNLPKMRATVRSGWPGRGLVLLLSAARRPLSLPRYHSRPPPARLISGPHNPTSPCLGGKRRPAPNASPATDAPSCTWTYPIPPPLPQGPLRPPDLLPPKSGLTERATRIT